jgi:hypothetical protein
MLIQYHEFQTGDVISINPNHVVCVFLGKDPKTQEKTTFINMINGNIAVSEDYYVVVERIGLSKL